MNRRRNRRPRRAGFTLMEVLLVLAILVILGSMVGFFIAGMQKTAYEDLARSQIGMFEGQLDAFGCTSVPIRRRTRDCRRCGRPRPI